MSSDSSDEEEIELGKIRKMKNNLLQEYRSFLLHPKAERVLGTVKKEKLNRFHEYLVEEDVTFNTKTVENLKLLENFLGAMKKEFDNLYKLQPKLENLANVPPTAYINLENSSDEEPSSDTIPWRMPRRVLPRENRKVFQVNDHDKPSTSQQPQPEPRVEPRNQQAQNLPAGQPLPADYPQNPFQQLAAMPVHNDPHYNLQHYLNQQMQEFFNRLPVVPGQILQAPQGNFMVQANIAQQQMAQISPQNVILGHNFTQQVAPYIQQQLYQQGNRNPRDSFHQHRHQPYQSSHARPQKIISNRDPRLATQRVLANNNQSRYQPEYLGNRPNNEATRKPPNRYVPSTSKPTNQNQNKVPRTYPDHKRLKENNRTENQNVQGPAAAKRSNQNRSSPVGSTSKRQKTEQPQKQFEKSQEKNKTQTATSSSRHSETPSQLPDEVQNLDKQNEVAGNVEAAASVETVLEKHNAEPNPTEEITQATTENYAKPNPTEKNTQTTPEVVHNDSVPEATTPGEHQQNIKEEIIQAENIKQENELNMSAVTNANDQRESEDIQVKTENADAEIDSEPDTDADTVCNSPERSNSDRLEELETELAEPAQETQNPLRIKEEVNPEEEAKEDGAEHSKRMLRIRPIIELMEPSPATTDTAGSSNQHPYFFNGPGSRSQSPQYYSSSPMNDDEHWETPPENHDEDDDDDDDEVDIIRPIPDIEPPDFDDPAYDYINNDS